MRGTFAKIRKIPKWWQTWLRAPATNQIDKWLKGRALSFHSVTPGHKNHPNASPFWGDPFCTYVLSPDQESFSVHRIFNSSEKVFFPKPFFSFIFSPVHPCCQRKLPLSALLLAALKRLWGREEKGEEKFPGIIFPPSRSSRKDQSFSFLSPPGGEGRRGKSAGLRSSYVPGQYYNFQTWAHTDFFKHPQKNKSAKIWEEGGWRGRWEVRNGNFFRNSNI